MTDFDRRSILVTGASGGIGSAIVRQLVKAGADVVASSRSEDDLAALAGETGCRTRPFEPSDRVSWMAELLPFLGDFSSLSPIIDVNASWRDGRNDHG